MPLSSELLLFVLVGVTAILFSSVGNAGAAGYLAAMAIVGVAPETMRPTALVLNVVVALVSAILFMRSERLPLRLVLPFMVGSVPAAYVGGAIVLPGTHYKLLVALLLLFVAWRLVVQPVRADDAECRPPPTAVMVVLGAVIGLLSGLSGIGGGIFLNPLLVLAHWAPPRRAAGATATFNVANSIAGVLGAKGSLQHVAPDFAGLVAVAAAGGVVGATLGSRVLSGTALRRILAVALAIVAVRLLIPG
jgi:uncharacterized membrane protein YfcA